MRTTASGLHRLSRCSAVAALPWARTETEAGSLGTVIHEYLANVPSLGREEALRLVPEGYRPVCERIDLEQLPACEPSGYAFEVGFAYDVDTDTAVELGRGGERSDGQVDDRVVLGKADVVGRTSRGVVVRDYKTGWADLGEPKDNWQLKFYALAAARAYGAEEAWVDIGRIDPATGQTWWGKPAHFTAMDLDAIALELAELAAVDERARAGARKGHLPTPVQGAHCKYCPAFDACPAKQALVRELTDAAGLEEQLRQLTTRELVPQLYERIQLAEQALERVKQVMREVAGEGPPIPLGDGYVYGVKDWPETVFEPYSTEEVLREAYGPEVAGRAVEKHPEVTKASLTRGLRLYVQAHPEKKISKLEKEALTLLFERGAAQKMAGTRICRFKPKATTNESEGEGESHAA